MSDDGYTLAEALAAIVMIGLAIGGLAQAAHVIGRLQERSAAGVQAQARNLALQQGLDRHLQTVEPVWSDRGGAQVSSRSAVLPCGHGAMCRLDLERAADGERLTLRDARGRKRSLALGPTRRARFEYVDDDGVHEAWPPAVIPRRTLRAIAVVDGERPLAVGRIWPVQPGPCVFDSVSGECRSAS